MKFNIHSSSILFIFLFLACQENSSLVTFEEEKAGNISLKIDKENAPSNMVKVIAEISRVDCNPVAGELNLLTDNSADIFFENIITGEWHLIVQAFNESEKKVYSGEADVTVLEGITTQINLVLYPTGEGTGSIYIYVKWGSAGWIDYKYNPIIKKDNSICDKFGVGVSFVLKDEDNYKMWYTGLSYSGVSYIYYAFSEDGIYWEKYGDVPVLLPDSSSGGSWDSYHVSSGPVIKENGIYKMYYSGWSDQYEEWPVGLATSEDGLNWTRYAGNPILCGQGWDFQIRPQSIIQKDEMYYMFFTGGTEHECKIGVATSSDGINWEKYSGNPVLVSDKYWEGYGVAFPSVIYEDSQFVMVYQGILDENTSFGYAYSTDGFHWTKSPSNPFFKTKDCNPDVFKISFPCYIKINNEQRIYYTGFDSHSSDWYICLTKKFN